MAKGKSSGIATAIGLIILFGICAFLTPPLFIAGMMGASDAPQKSSGLTKVLLIVGLPALPWIFFTCIAAAALRTPKADAEAGRPKPGFILKSFCAFLIAVFLYLVYVVFWQGL